MYLIGQAVDLSVKENFALFVNDIFIEALQDLIAEIIIELKLMGNCGVPSSNFSVHVTPQSQLFSY